MSNRDAIVKYYDSAEADYRLVWHLHSEMAMHLGYWDETTKNLRQALRRQNEVLAEAAAIRASDYVLDAGCGVGGSSIYLARELGCSVKGITLSALQARTARSNAIRHHVEHLVEFEVRDFTATGLPDEVFDVVWAIESVCYAQDKSAFLKEAYRILKPGGRLVLADGFLTRPEKELAPDDAALERSVLRGWVVPSLDTPQQFSDAVASVGFRLLKEENITHHIVRSSKRLYRLSHLRWIDYLLHKLHLRSEVLHLNVAAARNQYLCVAKGLAGYYLYLATKPPTT